MHCIKIVHINTVMIFVINKYCIEGVGGGKRKNEYGSVCVSVNICSPALDNKTGWCKEITGILGHIKSLVL